MKLFQILRPLRLAVVLIAAMFMSLAAHAQTILRVDATSTAPTPNGSTWSLAYKHLQDALAATSGASSTNLFQIWVADGIYYPDRTAAIPTGSTLRTDRFELREFVEVFGGFVGGVNGETSKNARNPLTNVTTLSGAINTGSASDNTFHIVYGEFVDSSARLDGFTITAGNAAGSNPLVSGDTESDDAGAGMALIGGPGSGSSVACLPVISRCRFTANVAAYGAGVYIRCGQMNAPQFRNCTFDSNIASLSGAGMFIDDSGGQPTGSRPLIINSLFRDNVTEVSGSAIGCSDFNTPTMVNSTVTRNVSNGSVGALAHATPQTGTPRNGEFNLDNDILWNNSRVSGGLVVTDLNAQLVGAALVDYSCVQALASPYSGTGNITSNPQFVNAASDFHLSSGSPCIDTGFSDTITDLADTGDLNQNGSEGDTGPDLDNRTRIVGAYNGSQLCRIVDMGAYEFASTGCTADIAPTPAGDGLVNIDDLLALIGGWGPCPSPPTACPGDISPAPCGDGEVNIDDLLAVISGWGPCPGPTAGCGELGDVPEEFWDCYDACSQKPDFAGCMEDCFKALCELGHTQYCE